MKEIWKDVKGYEGRFKISNYGNVRSIIIRGNTYSRYLKPSKNNSGYYYVVLSFKGKSKSFSIHRLVCDAFLFNPDNKPWINHKDGKKENNTVNNLEWCTASENFIHALDTGLIRTGENRFRAKLTNDQVREIRELHKIGIRQVDIAAKLNVTNTIVWACIHGYCYKRVI